MSEYDVCLLRILLLELCTLADEERCHVYCKSMGKYELSTLRRLCPFSLLKEMSKKAKHV